MSRSIARLQSFPKPSVFETTADSTGLDHTTRSAAPTGLLHQCGTKFRIGNFMHSNGRLSAGEAVPARRVEEVRVGGVHADSERLAERLAGVRAGLGRDPAARGLHRDEHVFGGQLARADLGVGCGIACARRRVGRPARIARGRACPAAGGRSPGASVRAAAGRGQTEPCIGGRGVRARRGSMRAIAGAAGAVRIRAPRSSRSSPRTAPSTARRARRSVASPRSA